VTRVDPGVVGQRAEHLCLEVVEQRGEPLRVALRVARAAGEQAGCLTCNTQRLTLKDMSTRSRAVIYARISQDPLHQERGVARQIEDARELARVRGWDVVAEPFVDNDLSALNGKLRPAYRDLLTLVESGGTDRVVTYMTSRLWRNRRERAEGIDRLRVASVGVAAVKGPDLDLTNASGRMLAGLLGEFDTHESEVKAERVARAAQQRAEQGRPNGTVPWGWQRLYERDERGRVMEARDVEDPATAPVVREIVDRLLAGAALRSITADLNARGVPAPLGGQWRTSSVRKVALRETNAARRVHQGKVLGPAAWPALVDPDKHDRVRALLDAPDRRHSRDGARRHLLTFGIGACGVCGGELRAATVKRSRKVARAVDADNPTGTVTAVHQMYLCVTGCVGRNETQVDDLVAQVIARRLARPDAVDLLRGTDDGRLTLLREQISAVRARLDTAADDYADGAVTSEQLRRITARLRPSLEDLERQAAQVAGPAPEVLADLAGHADALALWQASPVTRQRAILGALIERVVILPTRKGAGFDPASVKVEWKA